jgi:hypothetical protein
VQARAEWDDVRFIARLTEAIGKVLYYPAILLVILLAGRFGYFDNWTIPVGAIVFCAVLAVYILVCAATLQIAGIRARRKALLVLRDKLSQAKLTKAPDGSEVKRLTYMIDHIEDLRTGAFRPLTENPIVHVMLIPSGSVGLLAVLNHLLPS